MIKGERKDLLLAYTILILATALSMISHWFAHTEQMIEFTILGYVSASIGWLFFGFLFGYWVKGRDKA